MWMGQGLSPLVLRLGHLFLLSCAAGVTLFWTLQTLTLFFMGLWRELMVCSGRQPVQRGSLCVNPASPSWAACRAPCSSSSGRHACAPLAWVCPVSPAKPLAVHQGGSACQLLCCKHLPCGQVPAPSMTSGDTGLSSAASSPPGPLGVRLRCLCLCLEPRPGSLASALVAGGVLCSLDSGPSGI